MAYSVLHRGTEGEGGGGEGQGVGELVADHGVSGLDVELANNGLERGLDLLEEEAALGGLDGLVKGEDDVRVGGNLFVAVLGENGEEDERDGVAAGGEGHSHGLVAETLLVANEAVGDEEVVGGVHAEDTHAARVVDGELGGLHALSQEEAGAVAAETDGLGGVLEGDVHVAVGEGHVLVEADDEGAVDVKDLGLGRHDDGAHNGRD